mgnify:CR=1 FL=1
MREFLIRQSEAGLEVIDPATGATTDTLTAGELIEQIISLFDMKPRQPYPMKTPQEWGEPYFARREK